VRGSMRLRSSFVTHPGRADPELVTLCVAKRERVFVEAL
jgi:hypothetical protein